MKRSLFLWCLIMVGFVPFGEAQNHLDYYRESIRAYRGDDFPSFLKAALRADSLRPNHPVLLFNLASGYALNNQSDMALRTLDYRSHFYASMDFTLDEDFQILTGRKEWDQLVRSTEQRNLPQNQDQMVLQLSKKGFHAEGIAYDAERGRFFLSDVRTGIIYQVDATGENLQPMIDLKEHGYWSALGISWEGELLWVTTAALPQFTGFQSTLAGKSAVLLFHIASGSLLKSFQVPGEHLFGEVLAGSGDVYVSDSGPDPVIYRLDRTSGSMTEAFTHPDWWNLQGMARSENGKKLYISDYIRGIYRIDIATGQISPLLSENEWLRGGDGVYLKNDTLIVLQNGSIPRRVATIALDAEGFGIPGSLSFTHTGTKELAEPSTGTWVGNELFYIANSPWEFYDEKYRAQLEEWPEIYIFRLRLQKD